MKGIIALIEHLLSNFVLCRDLCITDGCLDQNVFTLCFIILQDWVSENSFIFRYQLNLPKILNEFK